MTAASRGLASHEAGGGLIFDTYHAQVLEEFNWTIPQLRDQRYEAVVHLVTAAIGAERFYTLENNKARMESRPEAIALDGRLARAWVGHNALHVVENGSGSFEEKIRKTVDVVCRSLGVPGPRSQPRWWIVRNVDEVALAALEPAEWKLEHVFLRTSDGSESRVTKKSSVGGGPATYHHRVRGKMVGDEHSTSERTLSLREYKALLKTRDPGRLKIKKTRRAFLWRDEYYMLDTFHSPESASGADSASSLTLNLPGSRRWRLHFMREFPQAPPRSSSRRPRASSVSRPSSRPRST